MNLNRYADVSVDYEDDPTFGIVRPRNRRPGGKIRRSFRPTATSRVRLQNILDEADRCEASPGWDHRNRTLGCDITWFLDPTF